MLFRRSASSTSAALGRMGALCLWATALLGAPSVLSGQMLDVDWTETEFIDAQDGFALRFDWGSLGPEERLSVWVDGTDITALLERTAEGLRYPTGGLPLPAGEREVTVHHVRGSTAWSEVGRFPLRVRGRFGIETAQASPSARMSVQKRVAQGGDNAGEAPEADIDFAIGFRTELARPGLTFRSNADLLGVVHRTQALRFGQLADAAPLVDLSGYSAEAAMGPLQLTLGHVSVGDHPLLIQSLASRGATARLQPHARVDLSVGAVSGRSVVGYDDLLGFTDPDHRVVSGSVGVDAFPDPGRLRVEVSSMTGSVLPVDGFNERSVTDAERSRGAALRIRGHALSRRVRLDLGLAWSAFTNPADPLLEQGLQLVPVAEETRGARFAQVSVDALRAVQVWTRPVRLSLGYRHERVDPQYRSLGAFAQADRLRDQGSAQAEILGVGLQVGHARSRDNLDDVRSVLTTRTERSDASVRLPVATIVGATTAWLPSLSASWNRTRQVGEGLPENGGFSDSHIPDQATSTRTAAASWSSGGTGLSLRWNRTDQDNRQPGREQADTRHDTRSVQIRTTPWAWINVVGDVGVEAGHDLERDQERRTVRYALQSDFRIVAGTNLSLRISNTRGTDDALARIRVDRRLDGRLAFALPGLSGVDGSGFLGFAHTRVRIRSLDAGSTGLPVDPRDLWTLDAGFSLNFF